VFIVGIVVAAALVAVLVAVLLGRRVSHDDVHSVEGYHRSLHTLESINAHPGVAGAAVDSVHGARGAYPESAVRLAGTATVRVTDAPSPPPVPPVPLPEGVHPDQPVAFDDAAPVVSPPAALPEVGHRDKAMIAINHRPRRLAAPAMALAGVTVLIVVLLVTGSHSVAPRHHGATGSPGHSHSSTSVPQHKKAVTTPDSTPGSTPGSTPVTAAPTVSGPLSSSPSAATYQVADAGFTLSLSATSGACWVDVTNSTSGAPLYVGTLASGQQQSFTATSPVTVVIGAPTLLAATVDGAPVQLPAGFRTPFTMSFVTAGAGAGAATG
jgi:Domain of unknown function (DUF4115)